MIKPGDLICIIPSVQTPLVIRPVEGRDGVFHIIGSSYVCGIMYGEAFKTPEPGHSPRKCQLLGLCDGPQTAEIDSGGLPKILFFHHLAQDCAES